MDFKVIPRPGKPVCYIAIGMLVLFLLITIIYISMPSITRKLLDFKIHTNCTGSVEGLHNQQYPRILHHMYKSKTIPNQDWQQCYNSCKMHSKNYKHIFWTDDDLEKFMRKEYPWFMDTYWSYPYHIERVDAVRYFILYHYGGVYMDLDIGCKYPFDVIFRNLSTEKCEAIFPATPPSGVTNSFMAAKKGHPFFKHLINQLANYNSWYFLPYLTVLMSTGPMFVTRAMGHYAHQNEIYIMDHDMFDGQLFYHVDGNSWHRWDGILIYNFYYNWHLCLIIGISVGLAIYILWKKIIAKRIKWCQPSVESENDSAQSLKCNGIHHNGFAQHPI